MNSILWIVWLVSSPVMGGREPGAKQPIAEFPAVADQPHTAHLMCQGIAARQNSPQSPVAYYCVEGSK